jgi:hypothetical protein
MSHFARVDKKTNKVTDVIVATRLHIYSLDDSEDWFQTSYNKSDGKPFASVGSTYDRENNVFIPPQPLSSFTGVACTSWVWNTDEYKWQPPIDFPSDYDKNNEDPLQRVLYSWYEEERSWVRHYNQHQIEAGLSPDWYNQKVGIIT